MRALSAAELLDVWERGQGRSLPQQALLLLAAAYPDLSADLLGQLSIGQRDARLLALREGTFGPQLVSMTTCPQCHEQLELTLTMADIHPPTKGRRLRRQSTGTDAERLSASAQGEPADAGPPPKRGYGVPMSLSVGGYDVQFRLPNSQDLLAVAGSGDVAAARRLLLERCLVAARRGDEDKSGAELPAGVVEAINQRMAQADPQADVRLALACPSCGHQWQAPFDIASFFWSELNVWAERTLYQVHSLARAYGWREADILALSPWRRQYYLNLASGT
jgi:hypothetical protein